MKAFILFLLLASFVSCQSNEVNPEGIRALESTCDNVSDPLADLPWLKEMVLEAAAKERDEYCYTASIMQGTYDNETVFIPITGGGALCCPCVGNVVFNCEGEVLFSCNPEEEAKVKRKSVIWEKK